jgi:hypothetical protein
LSGTLDLHPEISQDHLVNQKIIPTNASWDETVWKGPIDFISSRVEGGSESRTLQQPQNDGSENEAASSPRSDGNASAIKVDGYSSVETARHAQVS